MSHVDCTRRAKECKTPFARLPEFVIADLRLSPLDIRLLARLIRYVGSNAYCWPSNGKLGRDLGRGYRTVQVRLARLKSLGYVSTEAVPAGPENRTGRRIYLHLAALPSAPAAAPPPAQVEAPPTASPVAPESDVASKESQAEARRETKPVNATPQKPRWHDDMKPAVEDAFLARVLAAEEARRRPLVRWDRPASIPELLDRLDSDPTHRALLADWLATDLGDRKSFPFYWSRAMTCPAGPLRKAYAAATRPGVRRKGAVFAAVLHFES